MYACCGIDCGRCECYQATRYDDDSLKRQVAGRWSMVYNTEISPSRTVCHGCNSVDSDLSVFCDNCEIRRCCHDKKLFSCSACIMFPCDKTVKLLKNSYAAEQFMKLFNRGEERFFQ